MTSYTHHVPGRLRIRSAALKSNPEMAEKARAMVAPLPGIKSVETNPLTGSLTLHYRPAVTSAQTICDAVARVGIVVKPVSDCPIRRTGEHLGKAAGAMLMDKLVERSAGLLIAALL